MKTKKRKILVLSDMKDSTQALMITSVEVAKMLNAEIEFFHVKKPTDIVDRESQLSAVRTINREHIKTDNDIKSMLNTLSEKENLNIDYKYAFGNIKEEIENQIKSSAPDLIVVGKRKSKTLNFIGDNITDFFAAKAAGVDFYLVRTGLGAQFECQLSNRTIVLDNLEDFTKNYFGEINVC